jgi:Zn-dependent peptidase ImmA (M78 family)
MPLVRGFKAEAERRALALWEEVGAVLAEPLDLDACAEVLGASLVQADMLVPQARLRELEDVQSWSFSACTFQVNGSPVIVLNPLRGRERQRADCAHELAHIALRHEMRVPERLGNLVFLTGNPDQEDEANWLAGAILLPRPAVLKAALRGLDAESLADHYQTTKQMASFRLNATGANVQAVRRRRYIRP